MKVLLLYAAIIIAGTALAVTPVNAETRYDSSAGGTAVAPGMSADTDARSSDGTIRSDSEMRSSESGWDVDARDSKSTNTDTELNTGADRPSAVTGRDAELYSSTGTSTIRTYRGTGHKVYQASRYWLPEPGIEQPIGPPHFRNDERWLVAGYRGEVIATETHPTLTGAVGSDIPVTTAADTSFLEQAYRDSAREVRLSYLATRLAGNADVKRFAERMIRDHGAAMLQIERIAAHRSDLDLDKGVSNWELLLTSRLRELSGREFDRMYMRHMIEDHEKAVSQFRTASSADSVVGLWAGRQLPKLEYHHEAAKAIGPTPHS